MHVFKYIHVTHQSVYNKVNTTVAYIVMLNGGQKIVATSDSVATVTISGLCLCLPPTADLLC